MHINTPECDVLLTEKEYDSENKASENVNEVGGEDFKEKKRSPTAKPVIILEKREKQMQTEVNNEVVSDISKRKYVISSREKTVESFFKQRMDNHKAK